MKAHKPRRQISDLSEPILSSNSGIEIIRRCFSETYDITERGGRYCLF